MGKNSELSSFGPKGNRKGILWKLEFFAQDAIAQETVRSDSKLPQNVFCNLDAC